VKKLNYSEPSVLRGILTALIALAASLGFVASEDIEGAAEALIPIAALLIPILQAVWTRRSVVSPKTHAEDLGRVASGLRPGPS
jgi:hypothetical protein